MQDPPTLPTPTPVAVAVESGGGVVLTGDETDVERLAASFPQIHAARI